MKYSNDQDLNTKWDTILCMRSFTFKGKWYTITKKSNVNPVFDETFTFLFDTQ